MSLTVWLAKSSCKPMFNEGMLLVALEIKFVSPLWLNLPENGTIAWLSKVSLPETAPLVVKANTNEPELVGRWEEFVGAKLPR